MERLSDGFLCPFESQEGIELCEKIPSVNYNDKWLGSTRYLDGVKPNDPIFNAGPVVKFIDKHGRSAMAIQYKVACPSIESNGEEYAVVAFQRYSNSESRWTYGGLFSYPDAIRGGSTTSEPWLKDLISTGKQTFTNCDDIECNDNEECVINLSSALAGVAENTQSTDEL